MATSSLGFGFGTWGAFPWGNSDWAEEALWSAIPEFYRLLDLQEHGLVARPLRGLIDTLKPPMEEFRVKAREFPTLMQVDECPLKHLPSLARLIGLQPSTDKPESFQRTEILNAHQLYLFKGTDRGYGIVASFEGLAIIVEGLWADTCEVDANLTTEGPLLWLAHFDDIPADEIHLDSVYTDRFAIWPLSLVSSIHTPEGVLFDETILDTLPLDVGGSFSEGPCRSYSLRLTLFKDDDTEIEDFENVSRRMLRLLEFMRPIHVRFDKIDFDGPKAAATWVSSVTGGDPASATWTAPITGTKTAAASWVTTISADLEG